MIAPRSREPCPECGCSSILEWEQRFVGKYQYRIYCGYWRITGCERNPPWQPSEAKALAVWKMKRALLK